MRTAGPFVILKGLEHTRKPKISLRRKRMQQQDQFAIGCTSILFGPISVGEFKPLKKYH